MAYSSVILPFSSDGSDVPHGFRLYSAELLDIPFLQDSNILVSSGL
jgi:hypothetical protein